jgi:hypothetical protein
MKCSVTKLIRLATIVIAILAGAVIAHAVPIKPVSYDMPNGYGTSVGGEYNYWDANYTGSGIKTGDGKNGSPLADGAQLSGGLGKLTDGIIARESWEWTDADGNGRTQQNLSGTGPYVGWTWGDPTITFHFAGPVKIDSISFYVDNPANDIFGNPRGGVAAPESFNIAGRSHPGIKVYPGNGPLVDRFTGLDLFVQELTVEIIRDISATRFWVFVSEITFDDGEPAPVPEPSTLILFGAGIAAVALFRHRRK